MMLLTGWKQIAQHLGYGIRTVQRWEAYGLPVKRVTASRRSPVIADSARLDTWVRNGAIHVVGQDTWENVRRSRQLRREMGEAREALHLRMATLRAEMTALRDKAQKARQSPYAETGQAS